ncbi:MAG TPA: DNA polymerase/3'-5' exonuclease PolX [Planctomycetaceae bacterium]|nr:DNA polymerase/3'-5' exonuclease PolX [Planctomycetaceae bacterium]
MNNAQIAAIFELLADLLEFQSSNPFRIRSYRNSARVISDLSESIATIVAESPQQLTKLDGIGKSLAEKCVTLVETGSLPQLDELRQKIPETVLQLLRIPGMGPKKAAVLYQELHIKSLDELKIACETGQVRKLSGFGEKTEQAILANLEFAATAGDRIYWSEADAVASDIRQFLLEGPAKLEQLELAGSYRRCKETIGDLDILIVSQEPDAVMDRFAAYPSLRDTIVRGGTKMSIRLQSGLQVDLRLVPEESFGAALQYFTGSKEHNVELRGRAKSRGLKINEWGVYRIDGEEETYIAGQTEEDVYQTLELPWIPPELRECRQEFLWAEKNNLPELLTLSEIRGDLHMHTTWTDGRASLRQMIDAAITRGLEYIAITDHSQRVTMANGLNSVRAREQWDEIDRIRPEFEGRIHILKGIECDILEKGGMDLPDDVLAEADWVLAAIHYGQKQPRQQITDRLLGAIEHPSVNAVAHPTGRLINRREAYDVDMDAVFSACKQHGKMLELNANPLRLDLHDTHCQAAVQHQIPIVINTDAHSVEGLDVMRFGILQARRAGLTSQHVANACCWSDFSAQLRA